MPVIRQGDDVKAEYKSTLAEKAGEPLRFQRIPGAKRDFASVIDAERAEPSF
jgi:hypothetical protein